MHNVLLWRTYVPLGTVSFPIHEPKLRLITRPMIFDRVVHHALIRVIEPIFESRFHSCSFACRSGSEYIEATVWNEDGRKSVKWYPKVHGAYTYPKNWPYYKARKYVASAMRELEPTAWRIDTELHEGRGQLSAVRHYSALLRKGLGEYGKDLHVVSVDFKHFFQSIDHDVLKALLRYVFPGEDFVLWLSDTIIDAVNNGTAYCPVIPPSPGDPPDAGIPIGFLPSQPWSNLVGTAVDWFLSSIGCRHVVRYADDIRILCGSREEGLRILALLEDFVVTRLRLRLSEKKTYVKKFHGSDTFCGYRVHPHYLEAKPSTVKRSHRRIEKKLREHAEGWITDKELLDSAYPLLAYKSWTNDPRDALAERVISMYGERTTSQDGTEPAR